MAASNPSTWETQHEPQHLASTAGMCRELRAGADLLLLVVTLILFLRALLLQSLFLLQFSVALPNCEYHLAGSPAAILLCLLLLLHTPKRSQPSPPQTACLVSLVTGVGIHPRKMCHHRYNYFLCPTATAAATVATTPRLSQWTKPLASLSVANTRPRKNSAKNSACIVSMG